MIQGVVNAASEAIITISLQGSESRTREIEAVVDTGYSGFLTLPSVLVDDLGLPFAYMGQAFLANDAEVDFDVHYVTVLWDGTERHRGRRDGQHTARGYVATPWAQLEHRSGEWRSCRHRSEGVATSS